MAAQLYTPDGFAKQIDTYKDLALSASNAIRNKSWDDNVSVASSVGSVSNTIDFSGAFVSLGYWNSKNTWDWVQNQFVSVAGTFSYVVPSGKTVNRIVLQLNTSASLPVSGKYKLDFDFSSDSSLSYYELSLWMQWFGKNQKSLSNINNLSIKQSSGDLYGSAVIDLQSNVKYFFFIMPLKDVVSSGGAIGGKFSISFEKSSASASIVSPGTAPSDTDIQSGIASTTSQIASSVNDVYDSIHDLMQHISNQLAALWDQMYNYMHVPTYNKLQEILLSIKSISMGSDLQKIADQISNSTTEQTNDLISNANSNQEKTDQAIQKHGNFIIEGLKSLFIPSDEYFKSWFDGMYSFFHDRLGFLMLPIDILIKFVNMFQNAGGGFSGVPFPEFKWIDGTVIIPSQTVQFDFLATEWGKDIQTKLYFVGDVIMIGALLALMHRKMEEVLRS